ncbi:MAG: cytochrome c [Planctomycetaceae bacterium]|nr:cytochrome c [Planctomycetaceae bacterium]MBV8316502.1 cytochrome c [Planctomycetaceae bacterium]
MDGMHGRLGAARARPQTLGPARFSFLALTLILGSIGCRSVPVEVAAPTTDRLAVAPERVARVEAGRAIYTGPQKCARCHKPKPVSKYTADEWSNSILPRMSRKAKLTDVERQDVLNNILAASGEARSS